MRVALNGWFLQSPATGTGQYLSHLLTAAAPLAQEDGLELSVVSTRTDDFVGTARIVASPLLGGNLGKVEFEHITFPRVAKRRHFEIAHVPHFGPPLFPSIPTVVTIHDLIPLVLPEYRGSLPVRLYTRLAAIGARRARMIIADSGASRRDIVSHLGIPPERVRVIYLAVDARLHPIGDPVELARVRNKYHLPEQFVLYLGGFDVRKNVHALIDAFGVLEHEMAEGCELVVAGRMPEANTPFFPDPRVGAGTNVRFLGHVDEDDKAALYSSARVLAYPSRYEGFGLPPLEAMECGCPVVCSNAGSLPEVVAEGGILLNPIDIGEWVRALRAVLTDETRRRELRARGLVQAAKFSWERTARETLAVYRDIGRGDDVPSKISQFGKWWS